MRKKSSSSSSSDTEEEDAKGKQKKKRRSRYKKKENVVALKIGNDFAFVFGTFLSSKGRGTFTCPCKLYIAHGWLQLEF